MQALTLRDQRTDPGGLVLVLSKQAASRSLGSHGRSPVLRFDFSRMVRYTRDPAVRRRYRRLPLSPESALLHEPLLHEPRLHEQKGVTVRNPSGYLKNAMQRDGCLIPTPGQVPCEAVRGPRTTPYVDPFSLFAGHASGGGGGEPSAGHFVVGGRRGRSRSPRGADRRGRSQSPSALAPSVLAASG